MPRKPKKDPQWLNKWGGLIQPYKPSATDLDDLGFVARGHKPAKATLDRAGVEAELRLLHNEIKIHERNYAKLQEDNFAATYEINTLKRCFQTQVNTINKLQGKSDHLAHLLDIADQLIKTLEAKCATDHVLAIRKLPPLIIKRGYKEGG